MACGGVSWGGVRWRGVISIVIVTKANVFDVNLFHRRFFMLCEKDYFLFLKHSKPYENSTQKKYNFFSVSIQAVVNRFELVTQNGNF